MHRATVLTTPHPQPTPRFPPSHDRATAQRARRGEVSEEDARAILKDVLKRRELGLKPGDTFFGSTKLFLKAGVWARVRAVCTRVRYSAAIAVQARARKWIAKRKYIRMKVRRVCVCDCGGRGGG